LRSEKRNEEEQTMIESVRQSIEAIAVHVKANSNVFVRSGQKMLSAEEESSRRSHIEHLADDLDCLAAKSTGESVTYREFESILAALHQAGFFPPGDLVSRVAQAFRSQAG
jgi:hypothetical protein